MAGAAICCGGLLVFVDRDAEEPLHVLMDRAWLLARMAAADEGGGVTAAARRTARAWAAWAHLGCEYDAETMAAVRRAHHVAYAPRAV